MKKKIFTGFIALMFACAFLFFMTSCAQQKAVRVSEGAAPPAEEKAEKAKEEAAPKTEEKAVEEAKEEVTEKEEVVQKEEALTPAEKGDRQARLDDIQRAQELADEIRKFESESIYFDFDKSDLKPPARAILKKKAEWLRMNPVYSLRIEGHCDERGTNEYNLALGERRAHSAMRFLMALGISGNRISTLSYGEERPAAPGHNEEAWAKNRRDEFTLIK